MQAARQCLWLRTRLCSFEGRALQHMPLSRPFTLPPEPAAQPHRLAGGRSKLEVAARGALPHAVATGVQEERRVAGPADLSPEVAVLVGQLAAAVCTAGAALQAGGTRQGLRWVLTTGGWTLVAKHTECITRGSAQQAPLQPQDARPVGSAPPVITPSGKPLPLQVVCDEPIQRLPSLPGRQRPLALQALIFLMRQAGPPPLRSLRRHSPARICRWGPGTCRKGRSPAARSPRGRHPAPGNTPRCRDPAPGRPRTPGRSRRGRGCCSGRRRARRGTLGRLGPGTRAAGRAMWKARGREQTESGDVRLHGSCLAATAAAAGWLVTGGGMEGIPRMWRPVEQRHAMAQRTLAPKRTARLPSRRRRRSEMRT